LAWVKTPKIAAPSEVKFALMLEDIQDPGNLGSMLRTALGAGVEAVYLSKGCTDAWSPKALRGGQGAQFNLAIIEGVDLVETIHNFAGETYATTLDGESLYAQDLSKSSAFLIGNEGAGLSDKIVKAVSHQISIPMHHSLESLNAAAATAVCLFERKRQVS
jgi:RNA methyltransferase, TrmH family